MNYAGSSPSERLMSTIISKQELEKLIAAKKEGKATFNLVSF
jgi:hypothetical protein